MKRFVRALIVFTALSHSASLFAQEAIDPNAEPPAPPPAAEAAPATTTYLPATPPPPPPAQPGSLKDSSDKSRPLGISVMGWLPWWHGFGIGVKAGVEIPIVPNGFISSLNDSISIEPSFSLAFTDWGGLSLYDDVSVIQMLPALAGLWSFHFSEQFRVYGAIALGYGLVSYSGDSNTYLENYDFNYIYAEFNAGVGYALGSAFALRAELGWHGLRGGIQILL